jgi:truncated hemoglobin YjbI
VNQRPKAFFDKYVITGKTYTTRSGAVIPDELQYYDGEMVHLYGECSNIEQVNAALARSGSKALTLQHVDGRRTAVAQLWSSRFTDTSIGPYNAMFIVVVVVRDDAPDDQASIRADPNGASSALPMLDGTFDAAAAVYENRWRLFLVRLLDTTQVAIDVGRERMGTDKRPGTIEMRRDGRRLRLSIANQCGVPVVRADLELAADPAAYVTTLTAAAATARIALRSFPDNTEYVYPSLARIGHGPVVSWQWRSNVAPRLQPVVADSVVFNPGSEEGRMLLSWGFTPKVLADIPQVRGVVTGLDDGEAGLNVARSITIDRAAANGPAGRLILSAPSQPQRAGVRLLRAPRPGQSEEPDFLPVLRLAGRPAVAGPKEPVKPPREGAAQPRWDWEPKFFGSLTALLRKEVVGPTPDGLRINWHVTEGSFVGPGFEAVVLSGAADWMRIRQDGVAIVNVQACFETPSGVRVYGSYGGVFDLGPDGYARALRDEFDPLPPVVVTPTYATADPQLEWLNRAQCIGVGRVDMSALRVEFDVYLVRVNARVDDAGIGRERSRADRPSVAQPASLYARMGGYDVIAAVSDDFIVGAWADQQLGRFFAHGHSEATKRALRQHVVDLLCELTGGPCFYMGRDMITTHKGLRITDADWRIAIDLLTASLNTHHVAPREQAEFLKIIWDMQSSIVAGR